ncbi:MAG TPA: di-trans,poly-cis-decaprenylcistransferase [Clostridiales bacterium]|mgnify:CR=1 FL=1|nr:di-trans,poly-cis-decaprenylcistransferase [Clostridiales bacterium]
MSKSSDFTILPSHVGVIMDGNGRWAKLRNLPRTAGHKEGAETFRKIANYACDLGIPVITFYAFSTENWSRPELEVNAIMDLFRDYLDEAKERQAENEERGMRVRFIGDLTGLDADIFEMAMGLTDLSSDKTRITVNVAVNYGGRQEILKSVKEIASRIQGGEIVPDDIDINMISDGLYTANLPDPDLIIRPSGEYRLSNFLTWQSAYSEFWFSDILWPDFTEEDFDEALRAFEKRNRRFGGI